MNKTRTVATWIVAGVVLLGAASAFAADEGTTSSTTRPPKNLKKVGDHWTPWDPPTPGPDDYLIQRGDTLWDLAGKWLADPFLWPQIWDQNRYILDSHWIYPGDPLVVPGKPTVVPPEGPPEGPDVTKGPDTSAPPPTKTPPTPAPPPLLPVADASDLYCSGYIEPERTPSEVRILGRELERTRVAEGDVVYLNRGRAQGIGAGDKLAVQRATRQVAHPETGGSLGTYVRRLGRLRVLAAQENTATAVVEYSCDAMQDGDEIAPWTEIPAPRLASLPKMDRYDVEPSGGASGYVVAVRDHLAHVGGGHVIHVDLGEPSGLHAGEVIQVWRENGELPRMNLGRAVVLTVEPGTATAKIYEAVLEIRVGDRVEVVR